MNVRHFNVLVFFAIVPRVTPAETPATVHVSDRERFVHIVA